MDGVNEGKKRLSLFSKYRYPAIILLVGILLMLLPGKKTQPTVISVEETVPISLEERLVQILSTIDGVGEVHVLLSISEGEQIIYQSDTESNKSNDDEDIRSKTILITDNQRGESGLVKQVNPPNYLGAVISCRGGDDPKVRLAVVDAVSTATGLGADRISVVKMK